MATAKLYLDTRRARKGSVNKHPLRIAINHKSSTGYISLNIELKEDQWNSLSCKIINHPHKALLNARVAKVFGDVISRLDELSSTESINRWTNSELCTQIKTGLGLEPQHSTISKEDEKSVKTWFERWIRHKKGRTKELYEATYHRIEAMLGKSFGRLHFEDMTRDWLLEFDDFMAETAPSANSRAIHMRNLRTVCNYAIDNNITTFYPFRRFKIETETTRKRNLDAETLRKLFHHVCDEDWQQRYLDAFKLSFMLIGINIIDLCHLKDIKDGRIEYIRSKTKTRYSIKLEPEVQDLLEQYQGKKYLLNYLDSSSHYRHFYNRLCLGLRSIRNQLNIPELTSYYARHSWATIASKIGIPRDTIAKALGHGEKKVTDIYIEFDMSKVDDANRRVLDYIFHNNES